MAKPNVPRIAKIPRHKRGRVRFVRGSLKNGDNVSQLDPGTTIIGQKTRILKRLVQLKVTLDGVDQFYSCPYAIYIKPGMITSTQLWLLRIDFCIANGRI